MNPNKKDIMIQKIIKEIENMDIAGYLKIEVKDLLKYLHTYKLQNVYQNIDALKEYLTLLDNQNTLQIHKLEYNTFKKQEITNQDIHYYVSKKGLKHIGEHKIHQKIWENHYNLNYIIQAIKGLLLLTADEFCNATPTRMSINRILWQKELNKVHTQVNTETNNEII